MTRPYDKFSYLFPPRPGDKVKLTPDQLRTLPWRNWDAQIKLNGTCNLLFVTPERDLITRGRHQNEHRQWKPSDLLKAFFAQTLPKDNQWYVFLAELMHAKGSAQFGISDTNYIHDMLVGRGEILIGATQGERQDMLAGIFKPQGEPTFSHYVISESARVWLARNYRGVNFQKLFETAEKTSWMEGLVMKNPAGKLQDCFRDDQNQGWQAKCRKPHKNYPT